MELHGGNIYDKQVKLDFSVNINPLGIPEKVRKAAIRGVELSEHYPDVKQSRLLRKLAVFHEVNEDRLVLGNGASELIYALANAVRPKRALVLGPTFNEYERALGNVKCQVEYYLAKEVDGFEIGENVLEKFRQGSYELLCICNPNNPTGKLIKKRILQDLVDIAKEKGVLVLIDECFMDFVKKEKEHTMLSRISSYSNVIILKAFTKIYAMPGLRLGYMVAGNKKMALALRKMLPPWNISVPAQAAGVAALKETDYVQRSRDYTITEREFMEQGLEQMGYPVFHSRTNYILFKGPKGLQDICMDKGILIRDAGSFKGIPKGFYRIGLKKREHNEQLLAVLKTCKEGENKWQNQL